MAVVVLVVVLAHAPPALAVPPLLDDLETIARALDLPEQHCKRSGKSVLILAIDYTLKDVRVAV